MRRAVLALLLLNLAATYAMVAGPPFGDPKTHTVALNGHVFTLPWLQQAKKCPRAVVHREVEPVSIE